MRVLSPRIELSHSLCCEVAKRRRAPGPDELLVFDPLEEVVFELAEYTEVLNMSGDAGLLVFDIVHVTLDLVLFDMAAHTAGRSF